MVKPSIKIDCACDNIVKPELIHMCVSQFFIVPRSKRQCQTIIGTELAMLSPIVSSPQTFSEIPPYMLKVLTISEVK